jgi:Rps23 Pro-64 3,4-dihydroxylase Tpa1-like proline 4-hydroxylase
MRNVEVEVTLKGGQSHSCIVASDSPLLQDLYVGLAASALSSGQAPATLIQLPIEDGRAAFSFMSTSIQSLTTRPAVLIQSPGVQSGLGSSQAMPASPPYVRIEDFLTPGENEELLRYAIENEERYEGSSVISGKGATKDDKVRKSRVLFAIRGSRWKQVFVERLKLHLPHALATLGVPRFDIEDTEIQLTASNDGDFFRRHADADQNNENVSPRTVTFVYYLYRTPKPFRGGDLLFYPNNAGTTADKGSGIITVSPQNNCLISFASNRWHEVDMVSCPTGAFADSRFTVNGWLRRRR